MAENIRNNPEAQRFELVVDGHLAEVVYRSAPGVLVLVHTGVPDELSGQGIASRLAKHVLEYARGKGIKIVVRCAFIAAYLKRHPEYQDLVL